jgi:uncharacterized phage infection (PIP) family protein YhgE
MKQLMSITTQMINKITNNSILLMLFYILIALGCIAIFLFSDIDSVNFIYNEF